MCTRLAWKTHRVAKDDDLELLILLVSTSHVLALGVFRCAWFYAVLEMVPGT